MSSTPKEIELQAQYSSPDTEAVAWTQADSQLGSAEIYWINTVRQDGRPHITPAIAIWHDGVIHFTTGPDEVKARNLEHNQQCIVLTTEGKNSMQSGFDVILEGSARRVIDSKTLTSLAAAYKTKYGWDFEVVQGGFKHHEGGNDGSVVYVFGVRPAKVFGYGRENAVYTATRWLF